MNKIEDFIIEEPYKLTEEDLLAIQKASPNIKIGNQWKKQDLKYFKKRLRDYLVKKQHDKCAYCRLDLNDNVATPEIDHIVSKDKKPEWK